MFSAKSKIRKSLSELHKVPSTILNHDLAKNAGPGRKKVPKKNQKKKLRTFEFHVFRSGTQVQKMICMQGTCFHEAPLPGRKPVLQGIRSQSVYILSPKISTKIKTIFPCFFWWENYIPKNYIIYTLHQPFSGKMTQIGERNILNLERDSYVPPIAIMMGEKKKRSP